LKLAEKLQDIQPLHIAERKEEAAKKRRTPHWKVAPVKTEERGGERVERSRKQQATMVEYHVAATPSTQSGWDGGMDRGVVLIRGEP